ncbi:MAG: hypothetical protein ACLFUU_09485 [Desulfobacteraceae bacterium]
METRKIYQQKLEAQLQEWRDKIDILEAQADQAAAAAKTKKELVNDLRQRIAAIQEKLAVMRGLEDDNWEELKERSELAIEGLKEALNQASQEFAK